MLGEQNITLGPIQRLKLELFREFGDDAKKALDFITFDSGISIQKAGNEVGNDRDGVYIVYQNGSYELFDGHNSNENVKYVGVISGSRRIAVALNNLGGDGKNYKLLEIDAHSPEESEFYSHENHFNAFEDFDGAKDTHRIIYDYGSKLLFHILMDGEYIPAVGEWGVLMINASRINEALEYVGGTPMRGWYWSSTEFSQGSAWVVNFSDGAVSANYKGLLFSVRAVAAF